MEQEIKTKVMIHRWKKQEDKCKFSGVERKHQERQATRTSKETKKMRTGREGRFLSWAQRGQAGWSLEHGLESAANMCVFTGLECFFRSAVISTNFL